LEFLIKEAIKDGTIDCIATDHAPHTLEDKEQGLDHAPCGMIGLETALALVWMGAKEHGMVDYVGLPTIEQRVTVKTILK